MKIDQISQLLVKRLAMPLPGAKAHDLMRATALGNLNPRFDHTTSPRPGGVLIMLYEHEDEVRFPLIQRQEYAGPHSGQISLPGGKSEVGENAITTALREAEEEVGIDRNLPQVIGTLSNFLVIPSNFIVTPVVAILPSTPLFRQDPYEVAGILTGTLKTLLAQDAVRQQEIVAGGQYKMMAPHFLFGDAIVWGATAMMLNELRIVLLEALAD